MASELNPNPSSSSSHPPTQPSSHRSIPPNGGPPRLPSAPSGSPSPSPRSSSFSLAAAASINAGIHNDSRRSSTSSSRPRTASQAQGSPNAARQRNVSMRINLNDPALPGPGELSSSDNRRMTPERASPHAGMGLRGSPQLLGSPGATTADPHHQRAPSLGELHQELEQEQEAQVNRLLQMIRQQQTQLQHLQQSNHSQPQSSSAVEGETPSSERSITFASAVPPLPQPSSARARSPVAPHRASAEMSRQNSYRSRRSSRDFSSPNLRPMSGVYFTGTGEEVGRDESAFYQAETQTLTRENQMLKVRIRELEKQVAEVNHNAPGEPPIHSNLAEASQSADDMDRKE